MKILKFFQIQINNIREGLNEQKLNWLFSVSNKCVIFCIILILIIISLRFRNLPPKIPLWFTRSWGLDRLADRYWIFLLPVMTAFWHIINISVNIFLTKNHPIFAQALYVTSIFVSILSCVATVSIISLIT
jgi:hypothetical protein